MSKKANEDRDDDRTEVTSEVGDEGGSQGDLEVASDRDPTKGSEAGEAVRPTSRHRDTVARDETGAGRRNP